MIKRGISDSKINRQIPSHMYVENKLYLLRQWLIGILVSVIFFTLASDPPILRPVNLCMIIAWVLVVLYQYSKTKGREYWVKLDDKCIEYRNSSRKSLKKYYYSDINRIDTNWDGIVLYLKKGQPVRTVRIETLTFEKRRELGAELRGKWMQARTRSPIRGSGEVVDPVI